MRKWLYEIRKGEAGQALPVMLVLLALGSLLIIPSLNYASTSLKTVEVAEKNIEGLYAADAGVEDALWRIGNDLPASFPYPYQITGINGMTVDVTIEEVTSISGEEVNPSAEHADWMEVTKSVTYNAGIYFYTMYITNKGTSIIKIEKILVDFPADLEYVTGSTSGNVTIEDPAVTGNPTTGITLIWEISPPYPTIEPGPDPENGQYNTEVHTFQLSGLPDIAGVEGHSFVEATRGDISTVCDVDSRPYWITAQAKDAADTVVATIRAGVWQGDELSISRWQIDP